MSDRDLMARLEEIYAETTMVGWDFSILDGELETEDPNWDFESDCRARIAEASAVLDVGTGGGERLRSLVEGLPQSNSERKVFATEGWKPNVEVARANLAPLGIEVVEYDPDADEKSSLESDCFDLIMNRHESLDAREVSRLLRPGGVFITQQVDGFDVPELHEWFKAPFEYPEVTLGNYVEQLENAGLIIDIAEQWSGEMRFTTVDSLLKYMALVPWDVPGFTVDAHAEKLSELNSVEDPIVLTQRRFRIYAHK